MQVANRLKEIGDEFNRKMKEQVDRASAEILTMDRSIYQIKKDQFVELCKSVLSSCGSIVRNGWDQVSVVYMSKSHV